MNQIRESLEYFGSFGGINKTFRKGFIYCQTISIILLRTNQFSPNEIIHKRPMNDGRKGCPF
ncbi:MAG TPA: hypothetical protein VMV49_18565 [Candidatus Deferrimicrobium sp.]|nr:hypothetical protein [Candidatus Deferrimicrobium sp.]